MLDVRSGLVLLSATVAGAFATALQLADGASWPTALLTAGAAAGGAIGVLVLLVRPDRSSGPGADA